MSSRRWIVRLAPAVVGGVLLSFAYGRLAKSGAAAAAPVDKPRPVSVVVAPVETRDVPVWLEGLGTVAAYKQVLVRAQVDGRLDQVYFREGQAVKKGQLLAQIDPRPFLVQLHQAEGALARDQAQLDDGSLNLGRYQELRKSQLVAQQQVDDQNATVGQAAGAVRVDQAAVESAKLNLDYARITSPLDGVTGVRLVDPGNLVHASDQTGLVVVTQLDPAALLFTLPEDELERVGAAQAHGPIAVEAWSRDGRTRLGAGTLLLVDNQINQATATLRLKAILPNPDKRLWPNQFVKARLLLERRRGALVVPSAAVQRGPKGTFVYVVGADATASPRPVDVALTQGELAVIARGLAPGEKVVVEGQGQIRPGSTVAARDAGAGARPGGR